MHNKVDCTLLELVTFFAYSFACLDLDLEEHSLWPYWLVFNNRKDYVTK